MVICKFNERTLSSSFSIPLECLQRLDRVISFVDWHKDMIMACTSNDITANSSISQCSGKCGR